MSPRVRAPELPQTYPWLNCDRPLSLKELRGRVVLLDFWTYCCINCLHILPDLKYLEQKYKDSLTVIGVHSAKFDNEKEIENIRQAILRYDIEHPVVVDSGFQIWQQYTVRAWPTLMVIDPEGYVVGAVSGEGKRDALDQFIDTLIQEHQDKGTVTRAELPFTLEKYRQAIASPLSFPGKVLADVESDSLFIADSGNHRIVVTTLTGHPKFTIGTGKSGFTDGLFAQAQFFAPQGMALDSAHSILYVADTENHAIRKVNLSDQTVETIAGTGQQSHQIQPHGGTGLSTALNSPWDLQQIESGLFVAMAGPHQIWAMDLDSGMIGTFAGTGAEFCVDGAVEQAAFAQPSGITTDGKELFIADSEISTIRAITLEKSPQVRTVCGSGELFGFGDQDGQGQAVRLQHCLGVAMAGDRLWVADTYNHKIKCVNPQTGECQTVLGDGIAGSQDGQGTEARFYEPSGLAIAGNEMYVADTNNHTIRHVNLETLTVSTLKFPGLCSPEVCIPDQQFSF